MRLGRSCQPCGGHVSGGHVTTQALLSFAPYYALWYPGPLAKDWRRGEEQPRYQHTAELLTLRSRGIDLSKSEVSSRGTGYLYYGYILTLLVAHARLLAVPAVNYACRGLTC